MGAFDFQNMIRFLINPDAKAGASITVASAEVTNPLSFLENRRHEIFELITALHADNPFVLFIGKPVIARRGVVIPAASGFKFGGLCANRE